MKAATRPAHITQRQADRAVKQYLRGKPYTETGISRVPCAHCGAPSSRQWSLRPCAIGKSAWYGLCDPCDLELNRAVVAFLKVPNGDALLTKYEAKS